jgi:hypothetical protein
MESREDLLYREFKEAVNAAVNAMASRIAKANENTSAALVRSASIAESISEPARNPLLERRAKVRSRIWPSLPRRNTLEICVSEENSALIGGFSFPDFSEGQVNAVVRKVVVTTDVSDLSRPQWRVDCLVLRHLVDITVASEQNFAIHVDLPIGIKIVSVPQRDLYFSAIGIPKIGSDQPSASLFIPALQQRLVALAFSGKISGKVSFELPDALKATGVSIQATRISQRHIRFYFSRGGLHESIREAPEPNEANGISVKLSASLLLDLFSPRVAAAISSQGLIFGGLSLGFLPANQQLAARFVASLERSQYIVNVKASGRGNARVLQLVAVGASFGSLAFNSVGNPQVEEVWASDLHAHVDTLIGGGYGTDIPDVFIDLILDLAKAVGLRLKVSVPPSNFSERVPVAPYLLMSVAVRERDVVLQLT